MAGLHEHHTADEEIVSKIEEAVEAIRTARLAISDASILIESDKTDEERRQRHGHADRELTQVQSHLQLGIIQLDEIGDDYRS